MTTWSAVSLEAQAPSAAGRQVERGDLRRNIYVMEGALMRAVQFGAQRLNREIRSVAPEMVALSGEAQARGVYLDGYGVFFDVGVPILHQSMVWSLRTMMGQDTKGVAQALALLKQQSAREPNPVQRAAMESAIARLELQIGPIVDPTGSDLGFPILRAGQQTIGAASVLPQDAVQAPVQAPDQATASPQGLLDRRSLQDPNAVNRAYTQSVQRELIDAMLDHGVLMAIGPDEFLTVGARDNMQRDSLAPPDPWEEVVTILLRIKGSDLAEFRSGRIDRDQAKTRVQVREF
jgi:hypothetical protein